MSRRKLHTEHHAVARIGWLRAAVLGANDGIISTASLIIGVAASNVDHNAVLISGGVIRQRLITEGYGESRPRTQPCDAEANRRVEVYVSAFTG